MSVALALGAGGARGWAHLGVLRALAELGVQPVAVAGSSAGALVGAAWATGRLDALEEWARGLTPLSFAALLDLRLTGGGVVGGREIVAVLQELGIDGEISELPRRFVAIAADLDGGAEVILRRGRLAEAVRASVALPGLIAPQRIDGRWLIDGGVVDPLPVRAARELGGGAVIAVDPNPPPGWVRESGRAARPDQGAEEGGWARFVATLPAPLRDWFGHPLPATAGDVPLRAVVAATIEIMSETIRQARLREEPPDLLLRVPLHDIEVLEFYRAADAIEAGAAEVHRHAGEIRALLQRQGGVRAS